MRPEITGKKILPLEERFGVTVNVALNIPESAKVEFTNCCTAVSSRAR